MDADASRDGEVVARDVAGCVRGQNRHGLGAIGAPTSLRERSRQLVTREILQTALRLFVKQGYDETPMAQIAQEAGVSQRTLFRYFGTKEDLLGGNEHQFGQVLMAAVSEQPAEAGAWVALRAGSLPSRPCMTVRNKLWNGSVS